MHLTLASRHSAKIRHCQTNIYIHIYIDTHIYIHIYIHICIHTHTHQPIITNALDSSKYALMPTVRRHGGPAFTTTAPPRRVRVHSISFCPQKSCKRAAKEPQKSRRRAAKELYISTQEPYISYLISHISYRLPARDRYFPAKERYIPAKEPCVSRCWGLPLASHVSYFISHLFSSAKEPCISAKEIYTSAKEPCVARRREIFFARHVSYFISHMFSPQKSHTFPQKSHILCLITLETFFFKFKQKRVISHV